MIHISHLRDFRPPKVESIVNHDGEGGNESKKWKFRVRWLGYES